MAEHELDEAEDEAELEWLASLAHECRCCSGCRQMIPCAGLLQGGFCDRECFCSEYLDDYWDGDREAGDG